MGVIDDFLVLQNEKDVESAKAEKRGNSFETLGRTIDELFGPGARHLEEPKSQPPALNVVHCGRFYSRKGCALDPGFATTLIKQLTLIVINRKASRAALTVKNIGNAIGKCVHAACVVMGMRTYLVPLLNLAAEIQHKRKTSAWSLKGPERRAFQACLDILNKNQGLLVPVGDPSPTLWLQTDARGLATAQGEEAAIGIYLSPEKFIRLTATELGQKFDDAPAQDAAIAVFELYAVLAALRIYSAECKGKLLGSLIDNPAAAAVLDKMRGQTRHGPLQHQMQTLAELIAIELVRLDARFTEVSLVPGEDNEIADAVSRGDWSRLDKLISDL
jgi:hypothetical protein